MGNLTLSDEQEQFLSAALSGYNVLVDACIGSGKTTAIQELCNRADPSKKILYLTYNKLLKLDARSKIFKGNCTVTNYHGFAWEQLRKAGVRCGVSELIGRYNSVRPAPPAYDMLILDEYQDLDQESADMLSFLKESLPTLQIVAVGDMCQKIYDRTTLDPADFITKLLGDFVRLEFTKCFRICESLAKPLSKIWGKAIYGCNDDCHVSVVSLEDALSVLSFCSPSEVLVLGSAQGMRSYLQNMLERTYPDVYNKYTIWSKVQNGDAGTVAPTPDCAVFTTYDGCKGMERDVCVVTEFTDNYWDARMEKPDTKYEILRNIFCVAASRGKRQILFVRPDSPKDGILGEDALLGMRQADKRAFEDTDIGSMFDFKFQEDVEEAYGFLSVSEELPAGAEVPAALQDGLIDLSFTIGTYLCDSYFLEKEGREGDLDFRIRSYFQQHMGALPSYFFLKDWDRFDRMGKILYLSALETRQMRYFHQVRGPLLTEDALAFGKQRLSARVPKGLPRFLPVSMGFMDSLGRRLFSASGTIDCVAAKYGPSGKPEKAAISLLFVSEISHVHLLCLACSMLTAGIRQGSAWNLRTGQSLCITVPDPERFLNAVTKAVTKRFLSEYYGPLEKLWRKDADLPVKKPARHKSVPVRRRAISGRGKTSCLTVKSVKNKRA